MPFKSRRKTLKVEAPNMSDAVSGPRDTPQGTEDPRSVPGSGETQAPAAKEAGASEEDWRETLRMVDLEDLHGGLYPDGCKTLDMILLANPQAREEQSLCVGAFATDAFYAAALLQRTAPVQATRARRWRSPGASISGYSSACPRRTPRHLPTCASRKTIASGRDPTPRESRV